MRLLYVDLEPDGLKELVGQDVEPGEEVVPGKCVLWDYSRDEMPYVCAYRGGFGPDTARLVKLMLEAMDTVCGGA